MDDREILKRRILDADRTAYERNILKVCGFLALDEQNIYHSAARGFMSPMHFLSGGHGEAERAAAFFLPDYMDREEAEAERICAVKVTPVNARFSDELTHRDYLGALMNLGIERECIGDILIDRGSASDSAGSPDAGHVPAAAYVFVLREMSELIARELTKVRHTNVSCEIVETADISVQPEFEELEVNIASERADAVIAAVYRVSRGKATDVIAAERVFINGVTVTSAGKLLKAGDRVSVRGSGKFIYDGISGSSKKGRLFADIRKFV
ncbi:MAG: YlmH/Sll1252 family protein [Eubacteriales bacterium]|nr:YlmH/Sll1252 family protein [Eubacteriales bacterium]